MKKLILFLALGLMISCDKDDDNNDNNDSAQINTLEGEWHLESVTCLCEPINLDIGEHKWNFDTDNNTLTIVNNVTEDMHTLFESGEYEYTISNSVIILNDLDYDVTFEEDDLYLGHNVAGDGPSMKFVRD